MQLMITASIPQVGQITDAEKANFGSPGCRICFVHNCAEIMIAIPF